MVIGMHGLKYFVKIAQFVISIKFYCNWCSNFISDNYSSSTATQKSAKWQDVQKIK